MVSEWRNIDMMNGRCNFKDKYTVAEILWLLKCAIAPVILDFLIENEHRKIKPQKLGGRRMKK